MDTPPNQGLTQSDLVLVDFSPALTPFRVSMPPNALEEIGDIDAVMEQLEMACCRDDCVETGISEMLGSISEELDSVGYTYDEICKISNALHGLGKFFASSLRRWGLYDRRTRTITVRFVGWVDPTTVAFEYLGIDEDGYLAVDDEDFLERSNSYWFTVLQSNSRAADMVWNRPADPYEKVGFLNRQLQHGHQTRPA